MLMDMLGWFSGLDSFLLPCHENRIMKKEYSKVLKKVFKEAFKERVAGGSLWTQKSEYIFPGEVVYSLGEYGDARVFVILIPSPKEDKFTVEIAWSRNERFPQLSVRPNDMMANVETAEEYSVRLPRLVDGSDGYWSVPKKTYSDPVEAIMADMQKPTTEEALVVLKPLVDSCVDKILECGIPYVEKVLGAK